jgi:Flp pilus assembly protein TadG
MFGKPKSGFTLIEATATICVMLPIMITVVMAIQEVSQAYQLKQGLAQAARQAVRDLAAQYGVSEMIATDRASQDATVYSKVTVPGVVSHQSQFDDGVFDTVSDPPKVTVTVHYKCNATTGLPLFPAFDPLNWGSNVDLNASATYSLK